MKVEYTLTLADAKAAERLHIKRDLGRRIGYPLLYVGLPILAVLGWGGFYALGIGSKSELSLGYSIIEVILITLAVFIHFERSKNLRGLVRPKSSKGEVSPARSIEINDERISVEIPGVARTELVWDAIAKVFEDEKVILFYVNQNDFILSPARAFTPLQRLELRNLVARHLSSRKSC